MHFQDEPLMRLLGSTRKRVSLLLWVLVVFFFYHWISFAFFFFIALKCYFQQLLSYKYLLFFFSSFPPGEKGRGPIENSALSLSGEFKCGSNNRFLLLFFFKFPVVLLPRSALKENRKGSLEYVHLYTQRQKERAHECAYMSIYKDVHIYTRTHAHTYIHVFSCGYLYVTNPWDVVTVKLFQRQEKKLGSGKSLEVLFSSKLEY